MQRWRARWTAATVMGMATLCSAASPASDYLVSPDLSAVTFTVYKWTVLKEQGQFKNVSGHIQYDPARPQDSRVDVTVQTASLDTNNATRDGVLRSDDFFDVQRYPTMRFVSRRVEARPDRTLAVSGDLTIHGVTRPIDVVVAVNGVNAIEHVGRLAGFETTFHIDRRAFGVNGTRWTGGRLVISPEVEIHLAIAAADHPLYGRTETGR
jgi:polyisoprenoid-binding protein YceI